VARFGGRAILKNYSVPSPDLVDTAPAPLRRSLWSYVVPIVVVAVALKHAHGVFVHDLSPWKGAGFGMFSTVDVGGRRVVNLQLRWGGDWCRIVNPDADMKHALTMVRNYPSPSNIAALAAVVRANVWGRPRLYGAGAMVVEGRVLAESLKEPVNTVRDFLGMPPVWALDTSSNRAASVVAPITSIRIVVSRHAYSVAERCLSLVPLRRVEVEGQSAVPGHVRGGGG
jgi:hypothetical protein